MSSFLGVLNVTQYTLFRFSVKTNKDAILTEYYIFTHDIMKIRHEVEFVFIS